MSYQTLITTMMADAGTIEVADPRHIEAWMRIEHPTLDALGLPEFAAEIQMAIACVRAEPLAISEELARSIGL